ncbi:MAG TPA: NADH-quinone oxidoreductase subunit J [Anaerolineales bacterium]|nr:NADH-quinone oxidoreductase subunit J [Anaerolineales bacterium]
MTALLLAGALACALQAVRANRLISSALYLAALSLVTAVLMYRLGAAEAAVVELSVGAGLVTVLFVFAIAITGEDAIAARSPVPAPVAWTLTVLAIAALAILIVPPEPWLAPAAGLPLPELFWEVRGLDALVQVGLIFAGVMGILGLLVERGREGR